MEFLGIPIFDNDFYKMIFRFCITIFFLTIVIRFLYYKNNPKIEYLFTYYMIGTIVFFLCFTLKKYELDIGMALGLFAIFGIIRYRTNTVDIREMTYLFVIIGVSVINSLANKKMSYSEILGANIIIVSLLAIIENQWSKKNIIALNLNIPQTKEIVYNNIDNIKPENHSILKQELSEKLGLEIKDLTIGKVDFLKNTAQISISYTNPKTDQ